MSTLSIVMSIHLPQYIALKSIRLYQKIFSPDHSWLKVFFPFGACRFYPSCSEYFAQAIERYGLPRGSWLGFKRLLRCHPWSQGGYRPF